MGIVPSVLVILTPLEARGGQLVGSEGARARGETARDDDCFLTVPAWIVSHDLGMCSDILRGELGQLVGLSVDPAQRFHVLWNEVWGQ